MVTELTETLRLEWAEMAKGLTRNLYTQIVFKLNPLKSGSPTGKDCTLAV